jgi:hypothetical protein
MITGGLRLTSGLRKAVLEASLVVFTERIRRRTLSSPAIRVTWLVLATGCYDLKSDPSLTLELLRLTYDCRRSNRSSSSTDRRMTPLGKNGAIKSMKGLKLTHARLWAMAPYPTLRRITSLTRKHQTTRTKFGGMSVIVSPGTYLRQEYL